MNWLLAALFFQYMISATAGLVGQVRGEVNLKMGQIVAAGTPVETGPDGLIDLQLNPGGYVRLRANSSAVFESTALADIQLTLNKGVAIVDVADADPPFPIKITAGSITIQIRKAGIYSLSPDDLQVFDGQVDLGNGTTLRKGDEANPENGSFELKKIKKDDIRHPYAPDRLKVYIQPKEVKDHRIQSANTIFAEFVRRNFEDVHDVEIVSKPDGVDYVMTVGIVRRGGDIGIFPEVELKNAAGAIVFSNQREDSEADNRNDNRNRATAGDLLVYGNNAASILIQDVRNRTGWR